MSQAGIYDAHQWMYLRDRCGAVRKMRVVGERAGAWLVGFTTMYESFPQSEYVTATERDFEAYNQARLKNYYDSLRVQIVAMIANPEKTSVGEISRIADVLRIKP